MNKKAESAGAYVLVIFILIGIIAAFYFGWISIGGKTIITPNENELPEISDDDSNSGTTNQNKFQQCTVSTDCTWDQKVYYGRETCSGAWRCMDSVQVGQKFCSYGCDGNKYAGDGICGGLTESELNSPDCSPTIGFIGELQIG